MHRSSRPHSPEPPVVWANPRPGIEWATTVIYVTTVISACLLGHHVMFAWMIGFVALTLSFTYRRHRLSSTPEGLELRGVWWCERILRRDIDQVATRPKYEPTEILLSGRRDPPWLMVIERKGRRPLTLFSHKSVIETAHASFVTAGTDGSSLGKAVL